MFSLEGARARIILRLLLPGSFPRQSLTESTLIVFPPASLVQVNPSVEVNNPRLFLSGNPPFTPRYSRPAFVPVISICPLSEDAVCVPLNTTFQFVPPFV